jgi:hypothetical protein
MFAAAPARRQAEGRAPNGITAAVVGSILVHPARCSLSQMPKFSAVVAEPKITIATAVVQQRCRF